MGTEIKGDALEKNIGRIALEGIKAYIDIDRTTGIQDDEIKSKMKFKVYNAFIDKVQDAIKNYEGEHSELLPYTSQFFFENQRSK